MCNCQSEHETFIAQALACVNSMRWKTFSFMKLDCGIYNRRCFLASNCFFGIEIFTPKIKQLILFDASYMMLYGRLAMTKFSILFSVLPSKLYWWVHGTGDYVDNDE